VPTQPVVLHSIEILMISFNLQIS